MYAETVEITSPEFKRFEALGDCIEGTLLRMALVIVQGKKVPAFFVKEKDGQTVKFLGGTYLTEKLMQVPFKSRVSITYVKDEPMADGKNAMKIFQVKAQKWIEDPTSNAALEITDDDIPF